MCSGEEYNSYWHDLVPLPWFVPRCQQFYPPVFLQPKHKINMAVSKLINSFFGFFFFILRYGTPNILAPPVLVFKHSDKRQSLMISWCWYWINTRKIAMFVDLPISESKVQFCRRESNPVLMFLAKSLIQQVTVLLECGGDVNSLYWLFIQQVFSNSAIEGFIVSQLLYRLLQPMQFDDLPNKMPLGHLMSSVKDVSNNFWL